MIHPIINCKMKAIHTVHVQYIEHEVSEVLLALVVNPAVL